MPITNDKAKTLRPSASFVKQKIIEFLTSNIDEWYTAREIAELTGIGYSKDIHIPYDEQDPLLRSMLYSTLSREQLNFIAASSPLQLLSQSRKTSDFQRLIDQMESDGDIQCVIDSNYTQYYHIS